MSDLKLGRLPAIRPAALKNLEVYASGPLPTPPAAVAVPNVAYPIDCNDRVGDCTIAGCDHLVRAWNAEVGEHDHLPTEPQIEAEYFKLTGGPDSGLAEAEVLRTWHGEGLHLFGGQIAAYAPGDPESILQHHQIIALFGGSYLGIECPASAQEQFGNDEPWTYVEGSPIVGGHCIVGLGYNATGILCATWGSIVTVTYQFLAHFLDELWAVIPHEFVEAKKDALGLNLSALEADLKRV